MSQSRRLVGAGFLLTGTLFPIHAGAQGADTIAPHPRWTTAAEIGGPVDDRLRLGHLFGAPTDGYLIRTASSAQPAADGAPRVALVAPQVRMVWNSDLPFSLNEGAMHAGRGRNLRLRGGARADAGWVSAALVPELVSEANRAFQTLPHPGDDGRHPFSSPWHWGIQSADLPLRFGTEPRLHLGPGESMLALRPGPVQVGVSTESQWWGPGIRNALVMSNNAGGFPHAFAATARPWRTPVGDVEARWILGRLTASEFFDTAGVRPARAIAGFVATFRPAFEPGLTLGAARTVYGPAGGADRALDVFRRVGRPNVSPLGASPPAPLTGRDQILSVFGRWVFPAAGLEAYGEWARTDIPLSPRDLLLDPQRSQGYTLGLQWGTPLRCDGVFRVQAEASMLEQTWRMGRHVASFYTSRAVAEGYTHRGQVIGAAIGPGASGQWIAAEYVYPGLRFGAFAGRIRWENDMLYQRGLQPTFHAHDVTVLAGVRGGRRVGPLELGAEAIVNRRANYLFQNQAASFRELYEVDVRNLTLALDVGWAPRRSAGVPRPAPAPPPPPEVEPDGAEDVPDLP
jgi:hypothetical protein